MTRNQEIANTILEQLGGRRFIVMTGAKDFVAIDNGLRFTIGRNASKANRVAIKLNSLDLYDIEFFYYRPWRFNARTMKEVPEKRETIKTFDGAYCDMLQPIFTETTGMYTHF